MRKLYQKEWFGIKFHDVAKTSMHKVADSEFYQKFYEKFYEKYESYSSLPGNWKKGKDEVAEHLYKILKDKDRILSIGCGTGYIEDRLIHTHCLKGKISAVEPGASSVHWIDTENISLYLGFFPDVFPEEQSFEFAYAAGIDYVFDDREYLNFLKSVFDYGINDFLLTEVFIPDENLFGKLKDTLRKLMSKLGLYDRGQLWGYLRSIDEHTAFLSEAGFKKIEVGKYNHGAYWIRALRD